MSVCFRVDAGALKRHRSASHPSVVLLMNSFVVVVVVAVVSMEASLGDRRLGVGGTAAHRSRRSNRHVRPVSLIDS